MKKAATLAKVGFIVDTCKHKLFTFYFFTKLYLNIVKKILLILFRKKVSGSTSIILVNKDISKLLHIKPTSIFLIKYIKKAKNKTINKPPTYSNIKIERFLTNKLAR